MWYNSLVLSKGVMSWINFKEELIFRLDEILLEEVVREFTKFHQIEKTNESLVKFNDIKAQILIKNPILAKTHFMSNFIGSLKEEIQLSIKMINTTTLKVMIDKARIQDFSIETTKKRNKVNIKSSPSVSLTLP